LNPKRHADKTVKQFSDPQEGRRLTIETEFVRQAFLIGGSDQFKTLLEDGESELYLLRVLIPFPIPSSHKTNKRLFIRKKKSTAKASVVEDETYR